MSNTVTTLPRYVTPAKDVATLAKRSVRILQVGWCKDAVARDRLGNRIDEPDDHPGPAANSDRAVEVCLGGALCRATGITFKKFTDAPPVYRSLAKAIRDVVGYNPVNFNNDPCTELRDVIAVIYRAARKLGAKVPQVKEGEARQ